MIFFASPAHPSTQTFLRGIDLQGSMGTLIMWCLHLRGREDEDLIPTLELLQKKKKNFITLWRVTLFWGWPTYTPWMCGNNGSLQDSLLVYVTCVERKPSWLLYNCSTWSHGGKAAARSWRCTFRAQKIVVEDLLLTEVKRKAGERWPAGKHRQTQDKKPSQNMSGLLSWMMVKIRTVLTLKAISRKEGKGNSFYERRLDEWRERPTILVFNPKAFHPETVWC